MKLLDAINKDLARRKSGRGRRPTPRPLSALRSCVAQQRDADTGRLAPRKGNASLAARPKIFLVSPLGDPPPLAGRLAEFDSSGSMEKGSSS